MSYKCNNTSENVMRIIKFILNKEKFSLGEIGSYLGDFGVLIGKETIYKYLRTLKKAGFDIQKTDAKTYKLLRVPVLSDDTEIIAVENILSAMNENYSLKNAGISEKLLRLVPENKCAKEIFSLNKMPRIELQKLEKYLKDNLRLEIYFKNTNRDKEKIIFELRSLFLKNAGIFLKGYDVSAKTPDIYRYDSISRIIQTPMKNKFLFGDKEAVIKFSSKMAKSYTLKEGEQVLKKTKDFLWVKTNYYEEKLFFEKILKYVDHCEIIKPLYLRAKYKEFVRQLLLMYNEI